MWDFVRDKSGAGVGFLGELRFPLPIYIPSVSPQSSSLSTEAGTIGLTKPNKKKICYNAEGNGIESRSGGFFPSIYLILSVALWPWD
jgi:hypothetical protein